MATGAVAFGPAWRATMMHDGQGLQHRPVPCTSRPEYTRAQREELVRITDQADELARRLRARVVHATHYDPRVARIAGKAHTRLLRRIWIGRQPYHGGM